MAFNFPSGATNGQQYTADNGVVYVFDGTKWNIQSAINNYAITGSNTFTGSQYITGSVEVYSDNWPEIRLINGDTGIQYHLQNTAGGNFTIHNDAIGLSTLRIDSGSTQSESHVHIFGDLYVQSGSIFSISGSHGYVRALSMVETPKIIGTGSITIQPDPNDTRNVQIYNTAPSDIHIKGDATYTFFGDDTNFLKIDNINSTITIDSTNGLFIDTPVEINGSLNVSGGDITGSIAATNGVVSGSSQLTSSYDLRYTLSGSVQPLPDGLVSGSSQIDIESTNGFTSYSSSVDGRIIYEKERIDAILSGSTIDYDTLKEIVDLVNLGTGSYETVGRGIISSSAQLPSGILSGSISYSDLINIPQGIVSESADLSHLNSFTSSYFTDSASFDTRIISATNEQFLGGFVTTSSFNEYTTSISTGSLVDRLNNLESNTGSYETTGREIISSSTQISNLGFVTGAYVELNEFNSFTQSIYEVTQSFYQLSGSFGSIDFTGINQITQSYLQFTQSYYGDSSSFDSRINNLVSNGVPSGTISSSQQITNLGFASGSFETTGRGILSGSVSYTSLTNIPSGIVSGSSQITSLLPNGVISGSSQVLGGSGVWSGSSQLPSGVVSGSSQLTSSFNNIYELQGRGILSGSVSYTLLTNIPSGIISGSSQLPSGLVSGSSQLTSSFDGRYELQGRGILSGSISYNNLTNIPSGIISSSTQLPSGLVSGSSQLTGSFETIGRGIISSSTQLDGLGYTSLSGNNTFTGTNVFSGSTVFSGSVVFEETREVIVLDSNFGLGTRNFDYNSGSTFYLNNLTGSGTWNVQNFVSSSQRVTPITFVVEQGATAYSASAYHLGGTSVTVKWQNGVTPIGAANKTDVFSLSVFRSGSTFNVLGSYSTFG